MYFFQRDFIRMDHLPDDVIMKYYFRLIIGKLRS